MRKNIEKKKIFLANLHNSNNPGDMAINVGTLDFLSSFDDYTVSASLRSPKKKIVGDPEGKLKNNYPLIKLFRPFYARIDGMEQNRFITILKMMLFLILLPMPKIIFDGYVRRCPVFEEVLSSDIILCNGGNLFYWNKHGKYFWRTLTLIWPVLLASKYKKAFGFLGQSFPGFDKGLLKCFFKRVFSKAAFVMVREPKSKDIINDLLCGTVPIHAGLDMAFHMLVGPPPAVAPENDSKFIAIVLRTSKLGDQPQGADSGQLQKRRENEVIYKTLRLIEVSGKTVRVKIVIQHEIDESVSKRFYTEILKAGLAATTELVRCREYEQLINIYRECDWVITFRFHAAIFAIIAHTPVVGLCRKEYGPKMPGLFEWLEFPEMCFDIGIEGPVNWNVLSSDIAFSRCLEKIETQKKLDTRFFKNQLAVTI